MATPPSAELVSAKKQRSGHRGYFTRVCNETFDILKNPAPDVSTITSNIQFLRDRYTTLSKLDDTILTLLCTTECDDSVVANEIATSSDLLRQNSKLIDDIGTALNDSLGTALKTPTLKISGASVGSGFSGTKPGHSRLPKLDLVKFDGSDIRLWPVFWDGFANEIHNNTEFSETTKFRYLLSLLYGKARDRVCHYRPSADAYGKVIHKLETDYGDREKLKNAHTEALMAIQAPSNDTLALRDFMTRFSLTLGLWMSWVLTLQPLVHL